MKFKAAFQVTIFKDGDCQGDYQESDPVVVTNIKGMSDFVDFMTDIEPDVLDKIERSFKWNCDNQKEREFFAYGKVLFDIAEDKNEHLCHTLDIDDIKIEVYEITK